MILGWLFSHSWLPGSMDWQSCPRHQPAMTNGLQQLAKLSEATFMLYEMFEKSTPAKAKVDTNILACQVFSSLAASWVIMCVFSFPPFKKKVDFHLSGGFTQNPPGSKTGHQPAWHHATSLNQFGETPGHQPTKLATVVARFSHVFQGDYGVKHPIEARHISHFSRLAADEAHIPGLCHSMGRSLVDPWRIRVPTIVVNGVSHNPYK